MCEESFGLESIRREIAEYNYLTSLFLYIHTRIETSFPSQIDQADKYNEVLMNYVLPITCMPASDDFTRTKVNVIIGTRDHDGDETLTLMEGSPAVTGSWVVKRHQTPNLRN